MKPYKVELIHNIHQVVLGTSEEIPTEIMTLIAEDMEHALEGTMLAIADTMPDWHTTDSDIVNGIGYLFDRNSNVYHDIEGNDLSEDEVAGIAASGEFEQLIKYVVALGIKITEVRHGGIID